MNLCDLAVGNPQPGSFENILHQLVGGYTGGGMGLGMFFCSMDARDSGRHGKSDTEVVN